MSRNYLGGQCFSDDTEGSVNGVDSSSSPVASERGDCSRRQPSLINSSSRFPSSAFKTLSNGIGNLPASNSPQSVSRATLQATPTKNATSQTCKSSWEKRTNSPDVKQKSSGSSATSVSRSSKHSAMQQHAASLDEGRVQGSASLYGQSNTTTGQVSNGLSCSYSESSSFLAGRDRSVNSSAIHISSRSPYSISPKAQDDSIVRKLFPSQSSSVARPISPAGEISPAVQTLFSSANSRMSEPFNCSASWTGSPLSSSLGSSRNKLVMLPSGSYSAANSVPLLESALSVNELEKQMNEEDSNFPSMSSRSRAHGSSPTTGRGQHMPAVYSHPVSHTGLVKNGTIHSSTSVQAMPSEQPAQVGENLRLLQPSVFSMPSTPEVSASAPAVATAASQKPLLLPCSIASVAAITLEPPTPVSIPSKFLAEGVVPSIPPLMHSPGMTAPPLSNSSGTKVSSKKASGIGLLRRSATVDSDPVASTNNGGQISSPSPELVCCCCCSYTKK